MEAPRPPQFGALLRQFRLDAGMTQQELAERAKLSVEAISTLERGARTRPYRETVTLLSRALDLSPARVELLAGATVAPSTPRRNRAADPPVVRLVRTDPDFAPKHNLPEQLTSFVGRKHEVDEIAALLREHRLVTVVGAGGVGKTRMVVQTGSDVLKSFPDGVWLVDLAPLVDQALVSSAVVSALRLPFTTGAALGVATAYLKSRRLLLILDNCEHVLAQARDVAAHILQSCLDVRILSTSREELDFSGERVYRLRSLSVPPDSCRLSSEALPYGAVALFVDRAIAVNRSFALTDDDAQDVAQICRRLDGIPLALELAAARIKVLAPRQISERLDQRFRLLTGGDPRALPRHQTMTALFDWSYDHLTEREQRFFEALSVFSGGCTLAEAMAVCATEGEDDIAVIDLIESLVTKSLLVAELAGVEERYRLLESSRQYAREKLIARGEQEQVARRHAGAFVEIAERIEGLWDTTPDSDWLQQANIELENWRVALEWGLSNQRDIILGQRLAAGWHVLSCFPLNEAWNWLHVALELVDASTPPGLVARLELAQADGARRFGNNKLFLAAAERALERYGEHYDAHGIAWARSMTGAALVLLGRPAEGEPLLQEALSAARAIGERRLAATVLLQLGWARGEYRDFAVARDHLTESLRLARVLGADFLASSAVLTLCENEFYAGDPEAALRIMVDLPAAQHISHYSTIPTLAVSYTLSAKCLVALGRLDEARVYTSKALKFAREIGLVIVALEALQRLAVLALLRPQPEGRYAIAPYTAAARTLGFVDDRCKALGARHAGAAEQEYHRALAVLRETLSADELASLMAAGAAMTQNEAIELAMTL